MVTSSTIKHFKRVKIMKLIGKGSFTKAYLNESGKVILKTSDPVKECMALGWFPNSKLFPKMEYLESGVYSMEYLGKTPKALKSELRPRQYRLYKALRDVFNGGLGLCGVQSNDLYYHWCSVFSDLPSEFNKEKESLLMALDTLVNFGPDIAFEISPRNIRVKNGFLVLLDCFFLRSELNKVKGW